MFENNVGGCEHETKSINQDCINVHLKQHTSTMYYTCLCLMRHDYNLWLNSLHTCITWLNLFNRFLVCVFVFLIMCFVCLFALKLSE